MTYQWFNEVSLLDVALRSLAVLLITLAIAVVCHRKSAAVMHRIWSLGIYGCLLIPFVTLLMPNLTLAILPSSAPATPESYVETPEKSAGQENGASVAFSKSPTANIQAFSVSATAASQGNSEIATDASSATFDHNTVQPAVAKFRQTASFTSQRWVLVVWLAGVVLLLLRMIQHFVLMRRTLRQCSVMSDERWLQLLDNAAAQLGVRQSVLLLSHSDALSPMVAGLLRPVVILPPDADQWSVDRRQMVLLHELAHVARRDVLSQALAGFACALYWFNPLAWWAAGQMRKFREIACDDTVVGSVMLPGEYAETLLDVARRYRSGQRNFVVAMARTNDVAGRITAVLDSTRCRGTLTRRSAQLLGIATLLISVTAGILQVTSRADDPKETPQEGLQSAQARPEKKDGSRSMLVRVTDEDGKQLSKARVLVSVWEFDGANNFPNHTYRTNDEGLAEISLPHRIRILRIWPSMPGYVPEFLNFANGTHKEGKLIPDEYTFQLAKGKRLGGVVVDEAGNPIAAASVQVRVDISEPVSWEDHEPMISTSLATGVTDEQGRWEITNAPAPAKDMDFKFELRVTHPEFVDDRRWGTYQAEQGITTRQLRDGTARLTMDQGIAISGTITGPDGEAVTSGLVIWDNRPYWATGVNETHIDPEGRYETLRLPPGDYPVTVVAPGFAPDHRTVKVNEDLQDVDFRLKDGNPIRLQIVDSAGNPIPNAYVSTGNWRGTEAIYNMKHPNVPPSGIPRRASKEGIYAWDWAPTDGVEYSISAMGYDVKKLTLVAKREPHRIVLNQPITISGEVVDAESGEKIQEFRVVPVKAYRPNFYSTDFQESSVVRATNGQYTIVVNSYGDTNDRYRVRVEASGYRTVLGKKSLRAGDPPLNEDFRLEKKSALVGTVVDVNNNPVNTFTVAIGTPTTSPRFNVKRPDTSFGQAFHIEGKNKFELPATFEPQRIRVFDESGFAEVLRQPDEPIGTIALQPWATMSGRLVQGGQPVPGEWIYFNPIARRGLTEARFQDSFAAKTDADGNFRFEQLPPTSGYVRAMLGPWRDSVLTSSQSTPIELRPGEHEAIVLGGDGATVTGRVVATGRSNDQLSKQWSLNYFVSRDEPTALPPDSTPISFDGSGPLNARWLRQDDFNTWLNTKKNHFVKLSENGQLQIGGVRSGEYDLVIQLYEQPAGCLVETIGQKVIPVTISADQAASGEVDLGNIEVECRIGPRKGSDMRAFEFTDSSGRVRPVNDMKGRYLVFHVWASWCSPCIASMPELKATFEKHASQPLTAIGLNVDEDADEARSLVRKNGWNWSHNFLGEDSDIMRQLAVSSVPAYYLIGPDGKLLGSANMWKEIQFLLAEQLP